MAKYFKVKGINIDIWRETGAMVRETQNHGMCGLRHTETELVAKFPEVRN